MDVENLIIGFIFLLTGIAIFVYKFRYHTIKSDEIHGRINDRLFIGGIALILLAIHLIWKEIGRIV